MFSAVAVDSGGNVYVAGYQNGTGTATYGAGVSAAGASAGDHSILVKYDSSGTALWARIVSGTGNARFSGIATDSGGNVYAAGFQAGTGTATYGTGVSATGSSSGGNAVVVKYDPSGNALWAKVASGSGDSSFNSVATDSAGNLYAAGYQNGTGTCTYGTGVAAAGAYAGGGNAVAVKYDSSGNALWASNPFVLLNGYDILRGHTLPLWLCRNGGISIREHRSRLRDPGLRDRGIFGRLQCRYREIHALRPDP